MASRRKKNRSSSLGLAVFITVLAALFTMHSTGHGSPQAGSLAAFRSCVISRESAGNPQVWNRQGYPYWGLYQFGKPLWTSYGGSAASWGHAGASEQDRVFYSVMSHYRGCQNWTPSDGCRYPGNGCP